MNTKAVTASVIAFVALLLLAGIARGEEDERAGARIISVTLSN